MSRRPVLVAVALAAALAALGLSALGARPAIAAGPYLEGIDVSHWQGQPNWSEAKAAGVHFAFVKATESTDYVDPKYANNRLQLRAQEIAFGAYHFAQPSTAAGDAVAEADHFVDTAKLDGRNLLPVLDLETHNGLNRRQLVRWTKAWLARVELRLGVKPMIYVSPSFWVERMGNTRWFADNGHRLWIAHWNVDSPTVPGVNWGGRGWTLWQYSSKGSVDGIDGDVDLDRYRGDRLAAIRIRNNR